MGKHGGHGRRAKRMSSKKKKKKETSWGTSESWGLGVYCRVHKGA